MARIHIGAAGGAPSNNFIRSLRKSQRKDYLIGTASTPSDLFLADTDEKYVVPEALSSEYPKALLLILRKAKPDFLHTQNDSEVLAVSRLRDEIAGEKVKTYLPARETIEIAMDKFASYEKWSKAGLRVPKTVLLRNESDLQNAFKQFGPKLWVRAKRGAAGKGALPTESFDFAKLWIEHFKGWGEFTAAERLTEDTVTWQSIWHEGELVVAQTRKRRSWSFGNRTLSGVTGITAVGETCSDTKVDEVAQAAIFALDSKPHGIFGVDMTYDKDGVANPTEINIGRFFTTHYFFTEAGLNMPEIFCNIALDRKFPSLAKKINPLPNGLIWIRGMDTLPALTTAVELEKLEQCASKTI